MCVCVYIIYIYIFYIYIYIFFFLIKRRKSLLPSSTQRPLDLAAVEPGPAPQEKVQEQKAMALTFVLYGEEVPVCLAPRLAPPRAEECSLIRVKLEKEF